MDSAVSVSVPTSAAIPDGSSPPAAAIAAPRAATRASPAGYEKTPAAASAVYSPSEWPAAAAGGSATVARNSSHNAYETA